MPMGIAGEPSWIRSLSSSTVSWASASKVRLPFWAIAWLTRLAFPVEMWCSLACWSRSALASTVWLRTAAPEDRALLEQALGTLEEQARRIVLLHAVTGLKHREIAQLLELPLATVLSKYHRALKKLKAQLEGDDVR